MRLLRRLADALLLATTIIFPSLRASRRGNPSSRVIASQQAKQSLPSVSLRASRFYVIASQPAWQSLPSITQ